MRFAPNPNGPLSLGHSRGVSILAEYWRMYGAENGHAPGSELLLRFDDTDPQVKPPLWDEARGWNGYDMVRDDFLWLTGLSESEAWILLAPKAKYDRSVLFLRPRDPERERWTGPRDPISPALKQRYGVDKVLRGKPDRAAFASGLGAECVSDQGLPFGRGNVCWKRMFIPQHDVRKNIKFNIGLIGQCKGFGVTELELK